MEIQLPAVVRAAHILVAALWLGAGALLTLYIMPSIRSSGAGGGSVIADSMRRGLGAFMASTAGLTIFSGAWLYWIRFGAAGTGGIHGTGPIMLTFGALAGVVAMIIGGSVLGRTSRELAGLAEAPASEATRARVAALHRRGAAAARVTLTLLVSALLLMVFSRSF
jgi:hypothetical protein